MYSWFSLYNLEPILGVVLKFYTSVKPIFSQGIKLKVTKFWQLINMFVASSYVCKGYKGNTGRGAVFCHPLS